MLSCFNFSKNYHIERLFYNSNVKQFALNRPLSNLYFTKAEVLTIGFNQGTTLLASAGIDRNIMLWSSAQNYDNIAVLKGHTNAITALTWTHTDRLLTTSADKSIANWDVDVTRI